MRFFKKTPKNARHTDTDVKESEILEAYTCWLKNDKLTTKQKSLLKNIQESTQFHKLKELIDFAHYRFQETESETPIAGSKARVEEKLMKAIRGESSESSHFGSEDLTPQASYSPEVTGNVDTDVLPSSAIVPTDEELSEWEKSDGTSESGNQLLAHLNLSFEKQDDEVTITDMGSSPTYVEGVRVKESAPIDEGSEIKCGEITIQVVDIESS
ncbi:FHA domain-containing protein [Candidatus Poribacteria bacterium]|nr:FHA domain-containing protein [Candidatus Poribacteria bacterium]